jgi:hypothetical protein
MLQKGAPVPQLKEWFDRLAPVVAEARQQLMTVKPSKLVLRSGCEMDEDGNYRLPFFWRDYIVSADDFSVRKAGSEKETSSFTASLILTYLATADGTTPSARWVSFRELPQGRFYVQAFNGYSGHRLARGLAELCRQDPGAELAVFGQAAEQLEGEPLADIGDAGYVFRVLPRVSLAVVYWRGDEEFASQAQVLFEDMAAHYLPSDGLAILGSQLTGRLLRTARG